MKKLFFFVFVLFSFLHSAKGQSEFAPLSVSGEVKHSDQKSDVNSGNNDNERKMAAAIKRLTNRSSKDLFQKRLPEGGILLDLQDRFQNVMLAKIDSDNEAVADCITSLDEANKFFAKNLETGAPILSNPIQADKTAVLAERYGMSGQEFEFYKNLIADAAARRAQSPNSATITIINSDGAGEGFNDPAAVIAEGGNTGTTLGEQRLNLFNYAASIWSAYLDTTVPIRVNSQFNSLSCTPTGATLGSAGSSYSVSDFTNAPIANTYYHAALARKLSGATFNGAPAYEINATFNSDVNNNAGCLGGERFYYGFDNSTPSGTVNLLVVLLHEMGHGLGFSSFVNGTTGAFPNNIPDIFSRYLYDRSTGKYWYQMTDTERQTSALNNGNVMWDGPNVKIASGFLTSGRNSTNGQVQLFTPSSFQNGSSISHWDTAAYTNLLMEPVINAGLPTTLDLTRQQMRDIGWFRDSNGDLSPDTITNVQTSSGNLYVGSNVTVNWTNNGGFNRNVTIELSNDGGSTFPTAIATNIANIGTYSFTVPNNTTSQGRLRVREADFASPQAVSPSSFNVQLAPTAADVSVSGRVTDMNGNGVSNAKITLTKTNGLYIYTVSDADGYYRLDGVEAGETSVFQVLRKPFTFAAKVIVVNQDISSLNFVAQSSVSRSGGKSSRF